MSTQILRGTPALVSATWYQDGDVADPGVVTVTIKRADGTALVADAATSGSGAEARTYQLTTEHTALLDWLMVTWASPALGELVTGVEVVGDLLFTVAVARAFGDKALSNAGKYPAADIEAARTRITDAFQSICGVAFVPRYTREVLNGPGLDTLFLSTTRLLAVRSVETRSGSTWTAWSADAVAALPFEAWGQLVSEGSVFDRGRSNIRVGYEHGYERCPSEISRAALILARNQIVESNFTDRATGYSSAEGTFSIGQAGTQQNAWSAYRYTGYPEVDAILNRYVEKVPVIG